jgi:hypothetical protein
MIDHPGSSLTTDCVLMVEIALWRSFFVLALAAWANGACVRSPHILLSFQGSFVIPLVTCFLEFLGVCGRKSRFQVKT